jgi:hypothetical protein
VFTLVAAGTAAHADNKKHEGKYCSSLASLKDDLQKLQALRDDSKVGELRTIANRIEKDTRSVEKEGSKIKTPAGKQFMASAERLTVETRAVSDDMTIGQVKARIRDDASNLEQSAQQLADESGCSEAMPPTSDQPHT